MNVTFCGHSDVSQRGNVRQDQGGPRYSPEYALHACKVDLTRSIRGTGTPALLLGTLAQLVSPWYFGMITAFIPK